MSDLNAKSVTQTNTTEPAKMTDFTVFSDGGIVYETNGDSIGVVYPNGTKELLAERIWTNGLMPEMCGKENISVFHVYHNPERVVLREGCGEAGGALWSFNIATKILSRMKVNYVFGTVSESPNGQYQVIGGKSDDHNEIRNLHVIDFVNKREYDIASLGASETYMAGSSEFDSLPYANIHWDGDQVKVDVFSSKTRKLIRTVSPQYKQ